MWGKSCVITFVWVVIMAESVSLFKNVQLERAEQQNSKDGQTMKRSDGLLDVKFHLTVEQKIERKLRKEFRELKLGLADLKTKSEKSISILEEKSVHFRNDLSNITNQVETIKRENHVRVAFTTKVISGVTMNAKSTVPYRKMYVNIGGGFNVNDSTFYCPQDGVYLISASLETKNSRVVSIILKNGKDIGHMIKGSSSKVWGMSSVTVTVHLRKGDKVWVKNQNKALIGGISFFSGIWISK